MSERLIEDGYIPSAFEPTIEHKKRTIPHELKIVFNGLLHRDRQIVAEARKARKK